MSIGFAAWLLYDCSTPSSAATRRRSWLTRGRLLARIRPGEQISAQSLRFLHDIHQPLAALPRPQIARCREQLVAERLLGGGIGEEPQPGRQQSLPQQLHARRAGIRRKQRVELLTVAIRQIGVCADQLISDRLGLFRPFRDERRAECATGGAVLRGEPGHAVVQQRQSIRVGKFGR